MATAKMALGRLPVDKTGLHRLGEVLERDLARCGRFLGNRRENEVVEQEDPLELAFELEFCNVFAPLTHPGKFPFV